MGRPVSFDFTTGGGSPEEFLMGVVYLEPTLMHTIGSTVVLPDAPYPVKLVNGKAVHPNVAVSPAGPEPAWAYKVTIENELTGKAWSEFRGVPTGTTQIAYKDLTKFVTTIPPQTTAGMMQNWADTAQDGASRAETAADRAEAPTDLMNKNLIEDPASLTSGALTAAIGGSFGYVFPALSSVASGDVNRATLQSAVDAAIALGINVWLPEGDFDITGTVIVSNTVSVRGPSRYLTTLKQTVKATPIFKTTAPGCEFTGFTFEGQGLDVTGLPLLGAGSFRGHIGVWATLTAHDLSVHDVGFRNIVIGVYVRDYLPGQAAVYSSAGLERFKAWNVHCENVWVGIEAGPLIDYSITDITGTYTKVSGTPSNGDTGSPPHLVYISSDLAHMSQGGSYDKISTSNINVEGGPLKIKHSTGFNGGTVTAHKTKGLAEFEACFDFQTGPMTSTEDSYADTGSAYGRGSVWFVDCERGNIAPIRVNFSKGNHGSGVWTNSNCHDLTFQSPNVKADRLTDSVDGLGMIRVLGNRNKIIDPVISSVGAKVWGGILIGGVGSCVTNPTITGAFLRKIAGPLEGGVVDYDPALVLPSRQVASSTVFDLTASVTARPLIRDRSVGQVVTPAFSDDFTETGRVSLAHTDDGKLWTAQGAAGQSAGNWGVVSGGSKYLGGSARSTAVVNGRKADGVLKAVIKALPTNDGEGLAFRLMDGDNYLWLNTWAAAGDYRVRLLKRIAGAQTQVAISTVQAKVGDEITVTMTGETVSIALNGVSVVTGTIAELVTATRHGLAGSSGGTTFQTSSISFT